MTQDVSNASTSNIPWSLPLIADNEPWRLVALFGVITLFVVVAKVGRHFLLRAATRRENSDNILVAIMFRALARSLTVIAIALAFPLGFHFLILGDSIAAILRPVQSVLVSLATGYTLYQLVDVFFLWLSHHREKSPDHMDEMLVPILRTSLRVTIVVFTLLHIAQSLTDKPLTSIIAGLGVGGLAIALAAQDTVKHFFGSLVLFADKPFQVGDRVIVDVTDGSIEQVGFRSTRIRTLEGHLVTIPNGDLANRTIINISCRPFIRHRSVLNIAYDTPPEKIERACRIIKEILDNHEGLNPELPPRVVFQEFGATSLNILVMFWYHPADYWRYMAFTENVNSRIFEAFRTEQIDFAFPTQTLYLAGDPRRPLRTEPRS